MFSILIYFCDGKAVFQLKWVMYYQTLLILTNSRLVGGRKAQ